MEEILQPWSRRDKERIKAHQTAIRLIMKQKGCSYKTAEYILDLEKRLHEMSERIAKLEGFLALD